MQSNEMVMQSNEGRVSKYRGEGCKVLVSTRYLETDEEGRVGCVTWFTSKPMWARAWSR